jgi:hypothetical protein
VTYLNREAVDWALDRTVGNPNDKIVLVAIARRVNKHWAAFPGRAELASRAEIAEVSVTKCLKRLEDNGHLIRVAFAATNGQDQRTGYVLAGCGRPLGELDSEFLALAFVDRKQPGVPLATKPQHWSGERTGEGRQPATPPGSPHSDPQGRQPATPRRKEHTEDQIEQEDTFGEAAVPAARQQDQKHAAVAEVRAAAPTTNRDHQAAAAATIPTQRQAWPSNQKRNADWQAQIAAADVDELDIAAGSTSWSNDHAGTARRLAAFRLGFGTRGDVPEEIYPQFIRHMYLYLLKDVAATDECHLNELLYPLDGTIEAAPAPFRRNETVRVPVGESVASFSARMFEAASGMPPERVGPWAAEIEDFLPGLWYEKRQQARERIQAAGLPLEIETIASAAVRLMIRYYADKPKPKWPMEVVPPSMRSAFPAQSASPAWAA